MTDRSSDYWQIFNLVSHFYAVLDARDYPSVIDCFTADGVWFRRGTAAKGKAAIEDAMANRPADFHTAHLVSNLRIELTDEANGQARFYLTGYPYHGAIPAGTYVPLPHSHMLTEFQDTVRKVDGQWRIAEKRATRTLYQSDAKLP